MYKRLGHYKTLEATASNPLVDLKKRKRKKEKIEKEDLWIDGPWWQEVGELYVYHWFLFLLVFGVFILAAIYLLKMYIKYKKKKRGPSVGFPDKVPFVQIKIPFFWWFFAHVRSMGKLFRSTNFFCKCISHPIEKYPTVLTRSYMGLQIPSLSVESA